MKQTTIMKQTMIILTMLALVLSAGALLAGCEAQQKKTETTLPPQPAEQAIIHTSSEGLGDTEIAASSGNGISPAEIAKHNSENDCWAIVDGLVYDLTTYISYHPGGRAILEACGTDATDLFRISHDDNRSQASKARSVLENFYIGNLSQ